MLADSHIQPRQQTPAKKVRRSEAQWQSIVQEYAASGLSQQAFCVQQGLALSSFYKWRKKMLSGGEPLRADDPGKLFVEVATVDREAPPGLHWDVELALGQGRVLRLRCP